ncbi:MAG: hypothetical protein KDB21_11885 [Acidimicrobiales bacterium]|nr:hypothetical protein [Acidimicrobiales bacterium]
MSQPDWPIPSIDGVLSADEVVCTAEGIVEWQLPSGMVPWYPGGHADPWNHIEAAMALDVAGFRHEAERAYQWLVDLQRPDGAWHQYYLADRVEQDKLDANCVAYIATGTLHHLLCTGDRGFLDTLWPVVDRAMEFVLDLQTPRGEIRWARHADGTPWSFALLTGSSSIFHSLRCAVALADLVGAERPDWELAAARLGHVIRTEPGAFAPKDRWAMDWYYPVLSGAIGGDAGRRRLDDQRAEFLMDGLGVRCVSDRPWVTAAETCECAMAYLSVGARTEAHELFEWAQHLRTTDGRYWTGVVYPQEHTFPAEERSTYTSAAVVLGADALADSSPAARLLHDPAAVPEVIDLHLDEPSLD